MHQCLIIKKYKIDLLLIKYNMLYKKNFIFRKTYCQKSLFFKFDFNLSI